MTVARVLVTGANGFVGQPLCDALIKKGHPLRRATRSYALDQAGRIDHSTETVMVGSLGSSANWVPALEGVECVIHLAARTHVMREVSGAALAEYRIVNVAGTEKLARDAAAQGVRRLVFLSSIKVNGERTLDRPFNENDAPKPEDPYGISKWEAEQALRRIEGETGLEVVILRSPLVYGPGVKGNFLRLLEIVQRGWPLPLASVHNMRSLVYVENIVDALLTCVRRREAAGKTYLVSDGTDMSTPQLFRHISVRLGVRAKLLPCPPMLLRAGAAVMGRSAEAARLLTSLLVDSSLIRGELGWIPPYSAAQGLDRTVQWYYSQTPA